MSRYEKDIKEDIAKRLQWSNRDLWKKLSENERVAVVDKYYDLYNIENIGIYKVIENNRDIRRNFVSLAAGTLLGVFGGIASNILLKYTPSKYDIPFIIAFFVSILLLIYFVDRESANDLGENHVLEYLLELTKKDQ